MIEENNEIMFQAKRAKSITEIKKTPDSIVKKYKNNKFSPFFIKSSLFDTLGDVHNKNICDLGCGEGELACLFAKLGAKVTAIDISPDLILLARRRANLDGVSDKINFIIADIGNYSFGSAKFDLVVSYGFLHHVNIDRVLSNIIDILKDDGKIIIVEPIDLYPKLHNFLSGLSLRRKDISSNEKPLGQIELKNIANHFKILKIKYFNFIARISRIIPGQNLLDYGSRPTRIFLSILYVIDWCIIKTCPFVKKYYRVVFIEAEKNNFKEKLNE